MSRIGKKPIPMPAGVKYTVSKDGNTVLVEGPKGKVTAMLPGGITLVQKDGRPRSMDLRARWSPMPLSA